MGSIRKVFAKMRLSVLLTVACLMVSAQAFVLVLEATSVAAANALASQIATVGALAAIKGLALASGVAVAAAVRGRDNKRRKREAAPASVELTELAYQLAAAEDQTAELLAALETEQCFHRIFCSASTGRLNHPTLEKTLFLLEKAMSLEPMNPATLKYTQAAAFGASRKSIAKCELHYPCSVSMDQAKKIIA